jgi:serine/threonine protein kinase
VFAIKVISKNKLFDQEEDRLKDEISLLQEIKHPNIIILHETFDEPDYYYLATEHMSGGDVLDKLNTVGFFSEYRSREIGHALLEAVSYLHSKKIVHRDLKLENLLFDSDKDDATIKVADFGFAKREVGPNSLTTMCGTVSYTAPEILRSVPYSKKVDMWSVGVITYSLLAGHQPFESADDAALKQKIISGEFDFDEWESVSQEARDFITSLLEVDTPLRAHRLQKLLDTLGLKLASSTRRCKFKPLQSS